MVLGWLRRCKVLGLRLGDLQVAERREFVAEGKAGNSGWCRYRRLAEVGAYLGLERPLRLSTEKVFVALKGPTRDRPLTAARLDEVLAGARRRAGLTHVTCHEPPAKATDRPQDVTKVMGPAPLPVACWKGLHGNSHETGTRSSVR